MPPSTARAPLACRVDSRHAIHRTAERAAGRRHRLMARPEVQLCLPGGRRIGRHSKHRMPVMSPTSRNCGSPLSSGQTRVEPLRDQCAESADRPLEIYVDSAKGIVYIGLNYRQVVVVHLTIRRSTPSGRSARPGRRGAFGVRVVCASNFLLQQNMAHLCTTRPRQARRRGSCRQSSYMRLPFAQPLIVERASMALTLWANALAKERFPMVLSTAVTTRPVRFLPSRTSTTSMAVVPSGCVVNV